MFAVPPDGLFFSSCLQPVFTGCLKKLSIIPFHFLWGFKVHSVSILSPKKKKKVNCIFMLLELSKQNNVDFQENIA